MSNNHPIHPNDILRDGADSIAINGTLVRKGTIAAFLANLDIIENPHATEDQKQEAKNLMRKLAPAIVKIGLDKHVIFKNPEATQILIEAQLADNNHSTHVD